MRDVDKLWLTERACLLVATASETDRAWQVRSALVDFFLVYRRTNSTSTSSTVVHEVMHARDETRRMLDEVRAIEQRIVQQLDIDARVRKLEALRSHTNRRSTNTLETRLSDLLAGLPIDDEVSIPGLAADLGLTLDNGLTRKIGVLLSKAGWAPMERRKVGTRQIRVYSRGKRRV